MSRVVVYNRVSSDEQNAELQLGECLDFVGKKAWEVLRVFTEEASAFKDDEKRVEFHRMVEFAKEFGVSHIVVWNMDRFSRQPPDVVLSQIRNLGLFHGIEVVAVHGDAWSELVSTVGKLKDMGFVGKALAEFLETIIRGIECQRAYQESLVKSERVKLAVRERDGVTVSYKGNKWGRKSLPVQTRKKIIALYEGGNSIREIFRLGIRYWQGDKEKRVSLGSVHKTVALFRREKDGICSES